MQHTITLYNAKEEIVGSWEAHNNIISTKKMRHIPDRSYLFQDTSETHMHPRNPKDDTEDGKYGTYGIVRFYVPGHEAIGVHSGRKYAMRNPGPIHPTEGCVRTTEEAMEAIHNLIHKDHLSTITVINNLPKKNTHKR